MLLRATLGLCLHHLLVFLARILNHIILEESLKLINSVLNNILAPSETNPIYNLPVHVYKGGLGPVAPLGYSLFPPFSRPPCLWLCLLQLIVIDLVAEWVSRVGAGPDFGTCCLVRKKTSVLPLNKRRVLPLTRDGQTTSVGLVGIW